MTTSFDAIVVGGGVMGAAAALQLAEGGMRVALCEARQLAMGASGVNAGTLSMQPKRVPPMPSASRRPAVSRWRIPKVKPKASHSE